MPAARSEIARPARREIDRLLARHDAVDAERLRRIRVTASREQRRFLDLLPLLLHRNHPGLPGFSGHDAPAGIAGYQPDRDTLLAARGLLRGGDRDRPQRTPPLLALYLIGSSGTLGQGPDSDYDLWLCHRPDLDEDALARLREKAEAIEAHAATLGLRLHLFVLDPEHFRQGERARLSDESSGTTQRLLLLEEFYRSAMRLAGLPPLWWLMPPERACDYDDWRDELLGRRLIDPAEWIDFGGLSPIGADEFFGAAHWQLFKSLSAPYKSLLKLLLFETFARDFPDIRWPAEEIQRRFHAEPAPGASDVDPYRVMMARIEAHLKARGEPERLELARRAFYLKAGVPLSRPGSHWKRPLLEGMTRAWGWARGELVALDGHREWKLSRILAERDRLAGELSRSYRLLTGLARAHGGPRSADRDDLALLGRKLYAVLERRPGKIDRIRPGLDTDLREPHIWLRADEHGHWHCHDAPPAAGEAPLRSARGPVELLVWLTVNGVIDTGSRVHGPDPDTGAALERIRRTIARVFPPGSPPDAPLERFREPARGERALVVVNAPGDAPPDNGHVLVSDRADPLSFGALRCNLVRGIDHVHASSWGELQVDHHSGDEGVLEFLCARLARFPPEAEAPPFHCDTPGHGTAIARRLERLEQRVRTRLGSGERGRYVLRIGETFHCIERRNGAWRHAPIGEAAELEAWLAEPLDPPRPAAIDPESLPDSPLPMLLDRYRPGCGQVFYRVMRHGIRLYLLDGSGALLGQRLPEADEAHFLIQQERFFESLRDLGGAQAPLETRFLRLERTREGWEPIPVRPPRPGAPCTELLLGCGPEGPWRGGFSLLSGDREFSSAALGERLWREVARYLRSLRRGDGRHPVYLTGVLPGTGLLEGVPLTELVRFKLHIERRLRRALAEL